MITTMVKYLLHSLYDRRISMKIASFLLTFWGQGHRGVAQTSHGCSPRALGADALSGECLGYPKVMSLLRAPSPMTCRDQSLV